MLTPTTANKLFDAESDQVWLALITLNHADLSEPIRVVHNTKSIMSRGNQFVAFAFEISPPSDTEGSAPMARLTFDNVTREFTEALRSIVSAPTVVVEVIRADALDTVEISWAGYKLRNVRWDALQISGDLVLDDIATEPFPAGNFSAAAFPGLF